MENINAGPILNLYPDSLGGSMEDIKDMLDMPQFEKVFDALYILPSIFHSDLDRGFSVIDYDLNSMFTKPETLNTIKEKGIKFIFDLVMNHASVLSKQFQDLLEHGEASEYKDFFINWNEFWQGFGQMNDDGVIEPDEKYIKDMYFRKPGLPILRVRMKDGKEIPYWNTFYQEVHDTEDGRTYLGQMDLNVKSPLVWEFYREALEKLSQYGAQIVRLDAFAYASKEPGARNFFNEPGTWELLERLNGLAKCYSARYSHPIP